MVGIWKSLIDTADNKINNSKDVLEKYLWNKEKENRNLKLGREYNGFEFPDFIRP